MGSYEEHCKANEPKWGSQVGQVQYPTPTHAPRPPPMEEDTRHLSEFLLEGLKLTSQERSPFLSTTDTPPASKMRH